MRLRNFVGGRWIEGTGEGAALIDPVLGSEVARASSENIDYDAALQFARQVGGRALRRLSYQERAALLERIAEVLLANRRRYYEIALANCGSPKADAAIDIEGAIYTLKYYARTAAPLGNAMLLREGDLARLGKDESFQALHIASPLRGAAVLINAFNFPAWGLWEKAAVALLSGVPVLAKPATATAWLAHQMVKDVLEAGVLPLGSLSIVCGSAGDLLDHVTSDDAVAFTGSSETAARIRSHAAVVRHSTRVNIEADSINVALLTPDTAAGSVEFELFLREVVAEMTVKAGQKCTAIRRILVPHAQYALIADAIGARLADVPVGNPRNPSVRMGPLVSKAQQVAVRRGVSLLKAETSVLFDAGVHFRPLDADPTVAAFVAPTLLGCERPLQARAVHESEIFGPVATLLPYSDLEEALAIARLGGGALVASVFGADPTVIEAAALDLACGHGRVHIVSAAVADTHTGHGNVMPISLHGGPGRAGNGQELGGLRALRFYHQFAALQGPVESLRAVSARTAELRV